MPGAQIEFWLAQTVPTYQYMKPRASMVPTMAMGPEGIAKHAGQDVTNWRIRFT